MKKLLELPRIVGPVLTVALLAAYHAGAMMFGYSITLAWLTLAVAGGVFVSGWRGGLAAAVFGGTYAFYVFPFDRAWQVVASMMFLAGIIGWQTHHLRAALTEVQTALILARLNQQKADLVDSANGNIDRLRMTLKMMDDLLMGWDVLADSTRRGLLMEIRASLATLLLLVFGWRKLAEERLYAQEKEK